MNHKKTEDKEMWPTWLRKGPMEFASCVIIFIGFLMMLQPFFIVLYTYSFITMLIGTLMFTVVSKFPE